MVQQRSFEIPIVNIDFINLPGKMSRVDLDMNDNEPEEILTEIKLINGDEIDALKARIKKSDEEDVFLSQEFQKSFDSISPGNKSSEFHETSYANSNVADKSESLFQSTETLIDNFDVPHSHSSCGSENEDPADKMKLDKERFHSISSSESVLKSSSQNDVTQVTASIHSGLLISPSSLTQDVPVEMGSDNKRISSVLESLDLQLVYIPATHQLVTAKTQESFKENEVTEYSSKTTERSENSETVNNENVHTSKSDSSLSTPTKMATTDSSSLHSVSILSPANLDDSSSICETDCLIKIKEPDQLTCDSSEFECNFPRINTNDSLLRTFTDASSLSSLSTGTDFSVSAASLDDGETGMCIDTGDGGFMEINLHTRNSYERAKNPSQDSGFEDRSVKPKRKGLSAFLSR